jgi:hypothetical protein
MQRVFRLLRRALIVISLVLCITSVVFWIRSYRTIETYHLTSTPARWRVMSAKGSLSLSREVWLNRQEMDRGIRMRTFQTRKFGFVVMQTEEVRTVSPPYGRMSYTGMIRTYSIPFWFPSILFVILPLLQLRRVVNNIRRRKRGHCPNCGYDLRASPTTCPECGREHRESLGVTQ